MGDAKATLPPSSSGFAATADAAPKADRRKLAAREAAWQAGAASSLRARQPNPSIRRDSQGPLGSAPKDAIFVTDVGWNKNGAGQQLPVDAPQSFITSGGMATMGFAPAAAIGAKIGAPHRKVICLVGDGGFVSVVGALATAVELSMPVLWVLFNNFCFSTIRTVGHALLQEHLRDGVHARQTARRTTRTSC